MVYDTATNKEMKAHIEKAITASEQKTKAELDNFRLAIELTIQQPLLKKFAR